MRALVDRLTVKLVGEIAQHTHGYDVFKLYKDLFLTENERTSMFREDIQSAYLSKIGCSAEEKKKSGVDKENRLDDVYRNKNGIPLDHDILKDDRIFFPSALSDELLFELRLAPASNFVIGSDDTQFALLVSSLNMKSFTVNNSLMRPCLTTTIERDLCTSMLLISRQSQWIWDRHDHQRAHQCSMEVNEGTSFLPAKCRWC